MKLDLYIYLVMKPTFITKTRAHSKTKLQMRDLLTHLQSHKLSFPFLMPVDWQKLGIPDYPSIISCPMDLSTVENKLKNGAYRYIEDYLSDLYLIWQNCCTFNPPEHTFFKYAMKLQQYTSSYIKNYFPKIKFLQQNCVTSMPIERHLYPEIKEEKPEMHIEKMSITEEEAKLNCLVDQFCQESSDNETSGTVYELRQKLLEKIQTLSDEHVNKLVMMIKKKSPCSVCYDEEGNISIDLYSVELWIIEQALVQIRRWVEEERQAYYN